MMQYHEYRQCDCEWISEIPAHWSTVSIKRTVNNPASSFIDGDWIESDVITSDGIRYLTTGNVGAIDYKEQGSGFISEETFQKLNCTEVFPGDILISRLNEPIGRACIVPELGYRIVVAVDNVIYRPNNELYDNKFLVYQMNCLPYAENANFIARGSTMPRISRTMLGSIKICVPPLIEQKKIASYLDKKCERINSAIDTQKKKIELLNELKQTIITNAVTKGLNPNAPMKDSGIAWIGKVPEHWDVSAFKRRITINNGKDYKDFLDEEIYPVMGSGGCFAYCSRYMYDGEALLLGRKGTIDKPLYIKGKFWAVDTMFYAIPHKDLNCKFAHYLSLTFPFGLYSTSTALPSMTQTDLGNNPVAFPPLEEQQSIVSHLDIECSKIDRKIEDHDRKVKLLNELKQSIITEAVTGKIKVC